jgi:phenylalanyl-tRNA synthetase alpha subunit
LFTFDHLEGGRLKGLEPLYRSTSKAYYEFVHLLDKLLSENINRDFFRGDVEHEEEINRKDGKIQVVQKGTIRLLEKWIKRYFSSIESQIVDDAFTKIRKIRKARQHPAHSIMSDVYDPAYFDQQQELMREAYEFVHALRLIFSRHPHASDYDVPDWLQEEIQIF